MTDVESHEDLPPVAHVAIVYTGPIAPHWDLRVRYGDQKLIDDFWARVNARLLLLPKHDPQFRRNKERVNRDAERERITCDWDLGEDDAETTITRVVEPAPVPAPETVVAEPPVAEVEPVAGVTEAAGGATEPVAGVTEAAGGATEPVDEPASVGAAIDTGSDEEE